MSRLRPKRVVAAPALAPAPDAVTWRDGVHIEGTPIWCDSSRARDMCFVSAAHEVRGQRHGQLIATAPTLALLARSDARLQAQTHLPVTYRRPFTLGTVRLLLLPSGHSVGSASLLVDAGGQRLLYAGPIHPAGDDLGGAGELLPCDTLVVAAMYGDPVFRFPPAAKVAREVAAYCREVLSGGGSAVLLVTSPSKGLDVAARLAAEGLPTSAHRTIHHAAQKLRAAGLPAPPLRRHGGQKLGNGVVLWPTGRRGELDTLARAAADRIALVSGLALDVEARTALRPDAAFAWSNHADYERLLSYIEQTGASRVYLTHRSGEALAQALNRPDRPVKALGPPRQMALF